MKISMKKTLTIILIFLLFNLLTLPSNAVTVPAGRKVLISPESVTSREINKGDVIIGYVVSDVVVNKKVVIKEDSLVKLYVNDVEPAHRWGEAGYISIMNGTVEDVTGEERNITLNYDSKGDEKNWVKVTAGICIATIILIPFGFLALIKGGEAKIDSLNMINAEIVDEFSI